MASFIDSVPHCRMGLADVFFAVPQESGMSQLENVTGVLSYGFWETHLSETERNLLTKFLPRGVKAQRVVQTLLMGGKPSLREFLSSNGVLHFVRVIFKEDLDLQCEELIEEEFGEKCNFDVNDAVQKLEKLGIIARERFTLDTIGRYYCVGLKSANEIIGTTPEELVLKAKQGANTALFPVQKVSFFPPIYAYEKLTITNPTMDIHWQYLCFPALAPPIDG